MTKKEIYFFLPIIVQMGHDQRDKLKDYWSRQEHFFMALYGNTLNWDRFFLILWYIHFSDNKNRPNAVDKNYDRLCKIRTIFEKLNDAYAKYYILAKNLAVIEVIVLFIGRVVFKQNVLKKRKWFGIKSISFVILADIHTIC
jgi:CRISPR/Cas system endoribonuclease Cas6 (RAMP superfamily)